MSSRLLPGDPEVLGRYELLGRLGEGGMGAVFLGRDADGRLVAVKVIKGEHAGDTEFRARFRSEVNRAREVPSFCTAEVLDADPEHEPPYMVVEFVDGPSLADLVRERGPLRDGSLHSVAVGVASALVAIHSAGIVHRDLKPANVLFALGSPKVIDFGIAKALDPTSEHTRTAQMVGTLAYMAPERLSPAPGQQLTPAVDVFAWGALVAYAGRGRHPFAGDNAAITAGRILTQPPQLDGLPPELRTIVERALEKDPARRPTAQELLGMLLTGQAAIPEDVRRAAEAARLAPPVGEAWGRGDAPAGFEVPAGFEAAAGFEVVAGFEATGGFEAAGGFEQAPPGRTRWALVAAAVVVLALVGGWAGLHLGRGGAGPAVATTAPPAPVSSSGASSGGASSGGVSSGAAVIVDSLGARGLWAASGDDRRGCLFVNGLVVRTVGKETVTCAPGSGHEVPGDQRVQVVAELGAEVCAVVWFRLDDGGRNGYAAELCPKLIGVLGKKSGKVRQVAQVKDARGTPGEHTIAVDVTGSGAAVSVDGAVVVRAGGLTGTGGRVTFGAIGTSDDTKWLLPGEVTFHDVRITA